MADEIVIRSFTTGSAAPMKPADARLWKAAGDFEEILAQQFVKTMRSVERDNDLFEECPGRETFDQMFSESLGRQLAKGGSLGIQEAVYRQMGGKYEEAVKLTRNDQPATHME